MVWIAADERQRFLDRNGMVLFETAHDWVGESYKEGLIQY
jgi:hypothetical protein